MNQLRIAEAAEAVDWLASQAAKATDATERVQMALHLRMAQLYLSEYLTHLQRGAEPLEALDATARGELEISESKIDLLRAVLPKR